MNEKREMKDRTRTPPKRAFVRFPLFFYSHSSLPIMMFSSSVQLYVNMLVLFCLLPSLRCSLIYPCPFIFPLILFPFLLYLSYSPFIAISCPSFTLAAPSFSILLRYSC